MKKNPTHERKTAPQPIKPLTDDALKAVTGGGGGWWSGKTGDGGHI